MKEINIQNYILGEDSRLVDALKIINKWAGYKFMIFELVTNSKMKRKVGKHPHRMKLSN